MDEPPVGRPQAQRKSAEPDGEQTPRSEPRDLPFAKGGARLEAMHFVASGASWFRHFKDTQLGFNCAWAQTGTGDLRCAPKVLAAVRYLDDRCTEPAMELMDSVGYYLQGDALHVPAPVPGDWVAAPPTRPLACTPQLPAMGGIYRVGDRVAPDASADRALPLHRLSAAGCQKSSGRYSGSVVHRVYPADADALAKGSLHDVDVGGDLTLRRVIGDDRSELTLALKTNDEPCTLVPDAGLCVPGNFARPTNILVYQDPGCSGALLFPAARNESCTPQLGLVTIFPETHVHRLIPSPRAFEKVRLSKIESRCEPASVERQRAFGFFTLGEEVTSALPKVRKVRLGAGPLYREQLVAAANDGLIPVDQGERFVDADKKGCAVVRAADGTLRCLPDDRALTHSGSYRDSDCREPLYGGYGDVNFLESSVWWIREDGPYPRELAGLITVKVYSGPLYARSSLQDGACVPSGGPTNLKQLAPDQTVPFGVLPEVEERAL